MKKTTLWTLLCIGLLIFGSPAYTQIPQQLTDVLTQHNDLERTGWNPTETILSPSTVSQSTFGLLGKYAVDDQIYAQPLVATGIMIQGAARNVVYAATVNNTVYAFDADDVLAGEYWKRNFTPEDEVPPNAGDVHASLCHFGYTDINAYDGHGNNTFGQLAQYGIVGTPVIDKAAMTMYFVSRYRDVSVDNVSHGYEGGHNDDPDWSSAGFYQDLHAISLITGNDTLFGKMPITATAYGTGDGNQAGVITFDLRRQHQRGGLLLLNGIVYIPYASNCDMNNYHGWLLGYNAKTGVQQIAFNTTPNDGRGGIWMSGAAPAVDADGNIYFATGNANNASSPTDANNVGLSVVKLKPNTNDATASSLSFESRFTPADYASLNANDLDFGTQVMVVPHTDMIVTALKNGSIIVMDAANLGGYNSQADNVRQVLPVGGDFHSSFAYFGGTQAQYLYQYSEQSNLAAYTVQAHLLSTPPELSSAPSLGQTQGTGAFMSVSSNGGDASTAILWVVHAAGNCNANATTCSGILHALRADNINAELWNSSMNSGDDMGQFAKMNCVSVANGKVYVPTFSDQLDVYGLKDNNSVCLTNVALNQPPTAYTASAGGSSPALAFDGSAASSWLPASANPYLEVDLQHRYDICKLAVTWDHAEVTASDYTIDISDDGSTWNSVETVSDNMVKVNAFNVRTTARYVRLRISKGGQYGSQVTEFEVYGQRASDCAPPSAPVVSGITQNSALVSWTAPVTGAADGYILKYKPATVDSWITKIVPAGTTSLLLSALQCGVGYTVQISSDCGFDRSSLLTTSFSTAPCVPACLNKTRYSNGDFGEVQVAGTSCFASPVFTIKGAGTGLGTVNDQFQFNSVGVSADGDYTMQVTSQDATNPGNMAGVMMRNGRTDTAAFVFVGLTSGSGPFFSYRMSPGGAAGGTTQTVMNGDASIKAPYWVKLTKSGSSYSGYISPDGQASTWTQVGPTLNLNFDQLNEGLAVASLSPLVLSTATFFDPTGEGTPLPIRLLNFTASNNQNENVSLHWATAMEENNDRFEIERSSDGTSFTKILTVKGAGNSEITRSYSAIDQHPVNGLNFYRLKQVDLDGKFSYSDIRAVNFGGNASPTIYPNPATDYVNVVSGKDEVLEVVIYNVTGKALNLLMNSTRAESMKIPVSQYTPGVYIIKMKTATKIYQEKLLKK